MTWLELSETLRLPPPDQDWGIVNGDMSRLDEFIVFVQTHPELLDQYIGYELVDLICSSMCPEHNGANIIDPTILAKHADTLRLIATKRPDRFDYWLEFWQQIEMEEGERIAVRHMLLQMKL